MVVVLCSGLKLRIESAKEPGSKLGAGSPEERGSGVAWRAG